MSQATHNERSHIPHLQPGRSVFFRTYIHNAPHTSRADIGSRQVRRRTALRDGAANFGEPRSEPNMHQPTPPSPPPRPTNRSASLRRSYRDRKDLYAKSLERELAKTRANETNLIHECEHLQSTVQILLERLSQHGIDPPSDLRFNGNGNVLVPPPQLASPVSSSASYPEEERDQGTHKRHIRPAEAKELPPLPTSKAATLPFGQSSNRRLCDLDPVMTGMEFVLT